MNLIAGRSLLSVDGVHYFSRGHCVFVLKDGVVSRVSNVIGLSFWRSIIFGRLLNRFFRNEISTLDCFESGEFIAVTKNGIHVGLEGSDLECVHRFSRGSRPLGICVRETGIVLYGEYGTLDRRLPVYVFASTNGGKSFFIAYQFAPGEIKHVHNVKWDSYEQCYWILTGDSDQESGIGRLSADFKNFEWLIRGSQLARAVDVIIEADELIYGTDSERSQNFIVRLNKKTREVRKFVEIPGSSLFCQKATDGYFITTCVEPSDVNKSLSSCLYYSCDGFCWERVLCFKKDRYSPTYFQFGTITLPLVKNGNILACSGQALRNLDGKLLPLH